MTDIADLSVYQLSMDLANAVHRVAINWDEFNKNTLGRQLVRSADSVPSNIAEGYGRYSFKENKVFVWYARGSLYEMRAQMSLAASRGLITREEFELIETSSLRLIKMITSYAKSIGPIDH
jgi:four helix bundle protein